MRAVARTPAEEQAAPIWRPCPMCWGQREQYAQGDEGTWFVRPCPTCLGIGDVIVEEESR